MLSIKYSHNGSTKDEIRGHLEIMSSHFQPPLAGRRSIRDYSLKLFIHAQREEAYCDDSLIGLVAYYINGKYAYVSNVSVLPDYSGKGIGSILLNKMESTLIGFGVGIVSMETADNDQSIAFYRKNGFDLDRQLENGMRRMVKYLNSETPLVSIICLVYNHANYLRECFEGFIMQRVNFPIEILVHDDASTDGSAEIIKEYTNRYPQLFKPIFQTINQYSKGVHISATYQYPRCRGKYIAVCEGDDYWTDPYKLQKQVDFLNHHPDYAMCFTGAKVIAEIDNGHADLFRNLETREYTGDEIISSWIVPTCTVLHKKNVAIPVDKRFIVGDNVTFLSCAKLGKVHCFSEQTAVYRQNAGGWTATRTGYQVLYKWLIHYIALLEYFPEFKKPIKDQIMKTYARLFFNRILHRDIIGIRFLIQGFNFGRFEFIPILVNLYKEWKFNGQLQSTTR